MTMKKCERNTPMETSFQHWFSLQKCDQRFKDESFRFAESLPFFGVLF